MIDGHGDPNVSDGYRAALQALFSVSYTLKFAIARAGGPSPRVGPPRDHEIHLGDPRRSAPERLKTIIPQPISPA